MDERERRCQRLEEQIEALQEALDSTQKTLDALAETVQRTDLVLFGPPQVPHLSLMYRVEQLETRVNTFEDRLQQVVAHSEETGRKIQSTVDAGLRAVNERVSGMAMAAKHRDELEAAAIAERNRLFRAAVRALRWLFTAVVFIELAHRLGVWEALRTFFSSLP